jgi:hypothetical protein
VGEIPNFGEDEPMLSAKIGASFLTKSFRYAYPGVAFSFGDSIDSATNSSFVHLSFVSDCFPTVHKEMKYESSCCPPIWRA